jgi:hypothetical protein
MHNKYKLRKIEPKISIIYNKEEDHHGRPKDSSNVVSLGSGLFLALTIIVGFVANFGSRDDQLTYLLPVQLTLCSVGFPGTIFHQHLRSAFLYEELFCTYDLDLYFWGQKKIDRKAVS